MRIEFLHTLGVTTQVGSSRKNVPYPENEKKGEKGGTIKGFLQKGDITLFHKLSKTHSRLFRRRRDIGRFGVAVVFLPCASRFIYSQRVYFI